MLDTKFDCIVCSFAVINIAFFFGEINAMYTIPKMVVNVDFPSRGGASKMNKRSLHSGKIKYWK